MRREYMNYSITRYDVNIYVEIENGVYTLSEYAATGKTRLYHLMQRYMGYGENIFSLSYKDVMNKEYTINIPDNAKLYLFDRYDMYNGMFADKIKELGEKAVVMIDCKSNLIGLGGVGMTLCDIEMKDYNNIHIVY